MDKTKTPMDSWNANLYDGNHSFVSMYGESLVELLAPKIGEIILDLGCGTGDLTQKLANYGAMLTGVDNSPNMIEQARKKYPHIHFIVQDAAELEFHEEFDAVFSNAALHWVKQPQQALKSIFKSLKQKGRFVAEFGGRGNIETITTGIIKEMKREGFALKMEQFPWFFPSIAEYTTLMEQEGFKVTFAQHFDRPTRLDGENGLRNWIEMFSGLMFDDISKNQKDHIITKVEGNLKEALFKEGSWIADYKRIRVIGIKE